MFRGDFVPVWYEFPEINPHLVESVEENNLDLDLENKTFCDACKLPIFSTPYISHRGDDHIHFLHECCNELHQEIVRHPLHPKKLLLHKQYDPNVPSSCNNCKRDCSKGGFFYQCPEDNCNFTLDILCATKVKIMHRSHRHELMLIRRRENRFTCGACGLEHDGDFYWCDLCNFYLHHECALLPNTIRHDKHKEHPLCITYDLPVESAKFQKSEDCSICEKKLSSIKSGIYFCTTCDYNVHISCATRDSSTYHSVLNQDVASGLVHLPMPDENTSLMQCLLKNKNGQNSIGAFEEDQKILKKKNIHEHDLILHEKYDDGGSNDPCRSYVCNACIEPIVLPPFYSCSQCDDFCLHTCCAKLPSEFNNAIHGLLSSGCKNRPYTLLPTLMPRNFFSRYWCTGCFRYCNGFTYNCDNCETTMDVRCALLPEAITYEGHGKSHILFLSYTPTSTSGRACQGCNTSIQQQLFYKCCSCSNFELHVLCALLPLNVSHKRDRHPLKLSFSKISTIQSDRDFCEICEESMDTECWYYHCKECDTLFHIRCIPCVGEYSMIKFGGSIRLRGHVCSSPLTSTRLLTSYSFTCSLCEEVIDSRVDGIAFECIKCCFRSCYDCADARWIPNYK
ncbi:uncharacterized protein LOC127253553 [Andrographis paniculata]|uniref:uncharacterized protein LOC127253553 n=1 Tax=Andrographis paniculata TaxID=175694 RepID=UPI0021E75D0B|nr:uncharacterized protein LOC127253553 [Andrographis paniculata]